MQKPHRFGTQILADCKIQVAQKMYCTNLSKCTNLSNKTDCTGNVARQGQILPQFSTGTFKMSPKPCFNETTSFLMYFNTLY